jgi:hypothetical protein
MNIGRLIRVETTGNSRGNNCYNQLTFVTDKGTVEQLLLTDREVDAAKTRASKNYESLQRTSWFDRLVGLKIHLFSRFLSWF